MRCPCVGAEPVVKSRLDSPSDDLDGVATGDSTGDVVVDSALVVEEVLVDGEGALHGSVVVELGLDVLDGGRVHDGAGSALVLLLCCSVLAGGPPLYSRFQGLVPF